MSQLRVFSLVILLGITVAGFVTAATVASAPTVTLEKAVHFTMPSGEDVVVAPGTYEVEATKDGLRFTPKDGKPEDAKVVQATPTPHHERLQVPNVVAEPVGDENYRVALLLPDGTSLEALGSYSGVRTRALCNTCTTLGTDALRSNSDGRDNTAFGYRALFANTTGSGNTAGGHWALLARNSSNNTAIGKSTLSGNGTGNGNTAVGGWALEVNANGVRNTAIGGNALQQNGTGHSNTAIGWGALSANLGGSENTATGANALGSNISGNRNTAMGSHALNHNKNGYSNTAMGRSALFFNDGSFNTAMGYQALMFNQTDNNTAIGTAALESNTSGTANTAMGFQALQSNKTGSSNTAMGADALRSRYSDSYVLGNSNTAVGANALENSITDFNTAIGDHALHSGAGSSNTGIGVAALQANGGSFNTAIGSNALQQNVGGASNTAVGSNALLANVTGSFNTAIGAIPPGESVPLGHHNILVHHSGEANDSGTIRIGDARHHPQLSIAGIVNRRLTGSAVPMRALPNGRVGVAFDSRQSKEDIQDMGTASQWLRHLHPVTFRYKPEIAGGAASQEYGLIAEEVAEVYPEVVGRGPDGEAMTVHYQTLLPMLLNEVQQQRARLQQQDRLIAEQQAQGDELRTGMQALAARLADLARYEISASHQGGAPW